MSHSTNALFNTCFIQHVFHIICVSFNMFHITYVSFNMCFIYIIYVLLIIKRKKKKMVQENTESRNNSRSNENRMIVLEGLEYSHSQRAKYAYINPEKPNVSASCTILLKILGIAKQLHTVHNTLWCYKLK